MCTSNSRGCIVSTKQFYYKLNDTRWSSADGWSIMQKVYRGSFSGEESNITIHCVINETLKLIDDFKIVFPK